VTPRFPIDVAAPSDRSPSVSPDIAGDDRFLVAYEHDLGSDRDIVVALYDGSTRITDLNVNDEEGSPTVFRDQRRPDVDCNGKRFTLVYSELNPPSQTDWNVYADEVYLSGTTLELGERRVLLSTSNTTDDNAQIFARRSGTGANIDTRNLVVWDKGGGGGEILGAIYVNTIGGHVLRVCPGDFTNAICPCGNIGALGNGCANSTGSFGGSLSSTGDASRGADTFVLVGSLMPGNSSALYFQGTTLTGGGFGTVFGDGLRCASGSVLRLATKTNSASGGSLYPDTGEIAVSIRGAIPAAGATRFYQVWYRNAAVFCTASTFNLTNALEVAWSN
jgi:hypothetical protein